MSNNELEERLEKYLKLTKKALEKVRIDATTEKKQAQAEDFLNMAKSYYSDALHFKDKGELVTALAAVSYAHAWLDAGVRIRLFDVGNDNKLFTLPE
ncbi:MAG: DUF357 domain-containing protein [Candidatus Diapherotrites archaeon]|nr:DUF357 domain-containing protein [Candidatus Diapherotrites archaeon]